MLFTSLPDCILYIEFFPEPCVELADANFDFGADPLQRINALQ